MPFGFFCYFPCPVGALDSSKAEHSQSMRVAEEAHGNRRFAALVQLATNNALIAIRQINLFLHLLKRTKKSPS